MTGYSASTSIPGKGASGVGKRASWCPTRIHLHNAEFAARRQIHSTTPNLPHDAKFAAAAVLPSIYAKPLNPPSNLTAAYSPHNRGPHKRPPIRAPKPAGPRPTRVTTAHNYS